MIEPKHLIGGNWRAAAGGGTIPVINPSDGEIFAEIARGTQPDVELAVAAARELLEETGYRAASVERLGGVNPHPALFGNRLHLFLARDVVWQQAIQNSEREETSVELVPLREIPERVLAGEIDHALVVAAFYWFEKRAAAAAT